MVISQAPESAKKYNDFLLRINKPPYGGNCSSDTLSGNDLDAVALK